MPTPIQRTWNISETPWNSLKPSERPMKLPEIPRNASETHWRSPETPFRWTETHMDGNSLNETTLISHETPMRLHELLWSSWNYQRSPEIRWSIANFLPKIFQKSHEAHRDLLKGFWNLIKFSCYAPETPCNPRRPPEVPVKPSETLLKPDGVSDILSTETPLVTSWNMLYVAWDPRTKKSPLFELSTTQIGIG